MTAVYSSWDVRVNAQADSICSPAKDCAGTEVYQIRKFLELGKAGSFIQNSPVRTQLRFQLLIHRWRVQYIE
jgi:hypothetical protein